MSNEQTDWTTEGYQAFSNGLNGITETVAECDVDHDTVMGCERLGNGWTDVDTNFCPKCGVALCC